MQKFLKTAGQSQNQSRSGNSATAVMHSGSGVKSRGGGGGVRRGGGGVLRGGASGGRGMPSSWMSGYHEQQLYDDDVDNNT